MMTRRGPASRVGVLVSRARQAGNQQGCSSDRTVTQAKGLAGPGSGTHENAGNVLAGQTAGQQQGKRE